MQQCVCSFFETNQHNQQLLLKALQHASQALRAVMVNVTFLHLVAQSGFQDGVDRMTLQAAELAFLRQQVRSSDVGNCRAPLW